MGNRHASSHRQDGNSRLGTPMEDSGVLSPAATHPQVTCSPSFHASLYPGRSGAGLPAQHLTCTSRDESWGSNGVLGLQGGQSCLGFTDKSPSWSALLLIRSSRAISPLQSLRPSLCLTCHSRAPTAKYD